MPSHLQTPKTEIQITERLLGKALVHCLSRPVRRGVPPQPCDVEALTRASPPALRCLKPIRVLWRRELEGLGVFNMNHREMPNHMPHQLQGTAPASVVAAMRESKCRAMIAPGYRPPAAGRRRD